MMQSMTPLSLDIWDTLSDDAREQICQELVRDIQIKLAFRGLEAFACGSQRHVIGTFEFEGATFSLVPGSRNVALGCDLAALSLSPGDYESLVGGDCETLEAAHDSFRQLIARLADVTSPRRVVDVGAILVERAPRSMRQRETELLAPFRLPTEDEWEYACGGGEDAFFRWGNFFPVRFMPPFEDADPATVFDTAAKPNAFGLAIAHDLYDFEWCATPGVFKGGDGGVSLCDQASLLALWSTLATPFRCIKKSRPGRINPFTRTVDPGPHLDRIVADARRIFSLDASTAPKYLA